MYTRMYTIKSKFLFLILAIAMLPGLLLSSCSSEDEDVVYSDYCYISAFSLGSVKRKMYTHTNGKDSLFYTTFSGTLFPFTIDQKRLIVENKDSLPYGSCVDKMLTNVTFTGMLGYLTFDEVGDSVWNSYNKNDSIDFSKPVKFVVFADDGVSSREYEVRVNVHQVKGDSMTWAKSENSAALQHVGERKAVAWKNQLLVLGKKGNDVVALNGNFALNANLQETATQGAEKALIATLQKGMDALWMSTEDGQIVSSTDGVMWTPVGTAVPGLQLVGVSDARLYALVGGQLKSSSDATDWVEESLDDEASYLPQTDLYTCAYTQKNGNRRILLVGNRQGDKNAQVWNKGWYTADGEVAGQWMYYPQSTTDRWLLPQMPNRNILPYDGGFIAMGGACKRYTWDYAPMDSILYSADHGLTWKPQDEMIVCDELKADAAKASHLNVVVDENNYLWVIADENIWRGRLNRMGYKK